MQRRDFILQLAATLPLATLPGGQAWANDAATRPWRQFELVTDVTVTEVRGVTQLWLPVPLASAGDYQRRSALHWHAPGASARLLSLPASDVELLHLRWADADAVTPVQVITRVDTRDRDTTNTPAQQRWSAAALQPYLRATRYLPTDGIVGETARRITAGLHDENAKARAIYAWVVENTSRDSKVRGCGLGDIGAMLASGNLGGKCADINGLFVALARAAGVPARDVYGVRVADSRLGYHSLGKSGDISKAQHCRAEFYANGQGWIAVDPADVRKVMLEEAPGGLGADDAKVVAARTRLFGAWEMNWIAYNYGHDVALPGSSKAPLAFLMYPNGESGDERLDSLDAATFRYSITSRELTA